MSNAGTKGERWRLKTPPLTSDYELYLDDKDETRAELIVIAGKPRIRYGIRMKRWASCAHAVGESRRRPRVVGVAVDRDHRACEVEVGRPPRGLVDAEATRPGDHELRLE